MNSIESLLAECEHGSSGQFPVDVEGQARKLVEFQSSEPALFLVQGVQAVNALRALRVSLNSRANLCSSNSIRAQQ